MLFIIFGCIEDDDWKSVIVYQVIKLYKRHDLFYLWSINEFYNLEKMNTSDSNNVYSMPSVFQFRTIEIVTDLNKRLQINHTKLRREKCSWTNLIGNTRRKFSKSEKDRGLYRDWQLCCRYNADKFNKIIGNVSWYYCINQNKKKIYIYIKIFFIC